MIPEAPASVTEPASATSSGLKVVDESTVAPGFRSSGRRPPSVTSTPQAGGRITTPNAGVFTLPHARGLNAEQPLPGANRSGSEQVMANATIDLALQASGLASTRAAGALQAQSPVNPETGPAASPTEPAQLASSVQASPHQLPPEQPFTDAQVKELHTALREFDAGQRFTYYPSNNVVKFIARARQEFALTPNITELAKMMATGSMLSREAISRLGQPLLNVSTSEQIIELILQTFAPQLLTQSIKQPHTATPPLGQSGAAATLGNVLEAHRLSTDKSSVHSLGLLTLPQQGASGLQEGGSRKRTPAERVMILYNLPVTAC